MAFLIPSRASTQEELKKLIFEYLESQKDFGVWKDRFTSSTGEILINILASIFEQLNYKTLMRVRESYVYTATSKSALYSLVQPLGYNPNRKRHATGQVRAQIENALDFDLVIPSGTQVGEEPPIVTKKEVVISKGEVYVDEIDVMQGEWVTKLFRSAGAIVPEGTLYSQLKGEDFEILVVEEENFQVDQFEVRAKIDSHSFTYKGEKIEGFGYKEGIDGTNEYKLLDKVKFLDSNTVIVRTDYKGGVLLLFGNGKTGYKIESSSEVDFSYLRTLGAGVFVNKGTDLGSQSIEGSNGLSYEVDFQVTQSVTGGFDEDSPEKIKYLAGQFFQTQGRAVTENDYKTFVFSYPGVISAQVRRKELSESERNEATKSLMEYLEGQGTTFPSKQDGDKWNLVYNALKNLQKACCTVEVSALLGNNEGNKVVIEPWDLKKRLELIEYLEDVKMISTRIELKDPIPKKLGLEISVIIRSGSDKKEIRDLMSEEVRKYCNRLGERFYGVELLDILADAAGQDKIHRVYLTKVTLDNKEQESYPDLTLGFGEYFEYVEPVFWIRTGLGARGIIETEEDVRS